MQQTFKERNVEYIIDWVRETGIRKTAAGLVPAASGFGVVCLVAYYATLSFTPDISFAQGALVAVQAGLLGALLLASVWITLAAPALIYQYMGIRPRDLVPARRTAATKSLVYRYLWTQLTTVSAISFFVYFPHRETVENAIYWGISVVVFVWSAVHVALSPLIWGRDGLETRTTFVFSILVVGLATSLSLVTLLEIRNGSPSAHSDGRFLLTFAVVSVLGCGQVAIGSTSIAMWGSFGAVLLLEVGLLYGAPGLYARYIANAVGIAEKNPITLIVASADCYTIKTAAKSLRLDCHDGAKTSIDKVEILNSLGSRWIVRVPANTGPTIILPGKDLVIVR